MSAGFLFSALTVPKFSIIIYAYPIFQNKRQVDIMRFSIKSAVCFFMVVCVFLLMGGD